MFKYFERDEILPIPYRDFVDVTLSNESPCASHIAFYTAIRRIGNINLFDINTPPSFGLTNPTEIKYQWNFSTNKIVGQDVPEKVTTGIFLSSADQEHRSSSNSASLISHQDLFNYTRGYLYRPDNNLDNSATALRSSSTAKDISVARVITIRRDLFNSGLRNNSFRMQMNNGLSSLSGAVNGASANSTISETDATAFAAAVDLKNPNGRNEGTGKKSYFGVQMISDDDAYRAEHNTHIDTASASITVEAIVRPFKSFSTIFFRRLALSGATESKNSFMKLELVKNPDRTKDAFRFYIRNATNNGDYAEDFAKTNIQASGLFVPEDVGVNIYDGNFHHIIASWSVSGYDEDISTVGGAGLVMGYIDGYKLKNREEVNPKLPGADSANGPSVQANMLEQRIPIKVTPVTWAFTGNNVYVGVSNYNRENGNTVGDIGGLAPLDDAALEGQFDGHIQHVRVWNTRFSDGTTGYFDDVGQKCVDTSDVKISTDNFFNGGITGGTSASNMVAWWYFNELSSVTAADLANSGTASLSGNVIGNATIKLFDYANPTYALSANTIDLSSTATQFIPRDFLYLDQSVIKEAVENGRPQGRIIRHNTNDQSVIRVGLIYYDSGTVTLDRNDSDARLDFLWPTSGTTGDFGFSVTGNNNAALNVERLGFKSAVDKGRLVLNAGASGEEFNYTQNVSGINQENEESAFDESTTFITHIGLYNDFGELLAIAKLSDTARKDASTQLSTQVRLDF